MTSLPPESRMSPQQDPPASSSTPQEWTGPLNPLSDSAERRVLFAALSSFHQYRPHTHLQTTHRRRQAFYALPSSHTALLSSPPISFLHTLDAVDSAVASNAILSESILAVSLASFSLPLDPPCPLPSQISPSSTPSPHPLDWRQPPATPHDLSKASTTIRQFYRDWSSAGAAERAVHYGPLIADLCAEFPSTHSTSTSARNDIKVLIPGCGLARLVFDLTLLGFSATGTEISYHALLASSYILNHCPSAHHHTLYPFATSFSNHLTRSNQLRSVTVPDVHPGTALLEAWQSEEEGGTHPFERMSVEAGDFLGVYHPHGTAEGRQGGLYDAVTTCFFIDTAPNFLRYVEAVHYALKEGGIWCNVGPLLWHFDAAEKRETPAEDEDSSRENVNGVGIQEPGSVELSWEEVVQVLGQMGFVVEKSEVLDSDGEKGEGYIADERNMLLSRYRVGHWVARKRTTEPAADG